MASDEDYMAFLDKANKDPNEGHARPASEGAKKELKTTDAGVRVPAVLTEAAKDAFYVSDADEPFVPVCLQWDEDGKGLPDEGAFPYLFIWSPLHFPAGRIGLRAACDMHTGTGVCIL